MILKDKLNLLTEHEKQIVSLISNANASTRTDKAWIEQFFEVSDETLEKLVRLKILDNNKGEYDIYSL